MHINNQRRLWTAVLSQECFSTFKPLRITANIINFQVIAALIIPLFGKGKTGQELSMENLPLKSYLAIMINHVNG